MFRAALLLCGAACLWGQGKVYPDRWVYLPNPLRTEQHLARAVELATTAAQHGLTGVLFPGMDRLSLAAPEYLERLGRFKQACGRLGLEVIPAGFSTGYGGSILAHDKNLAAGLAVKRALFVAGGQQARFRADSPAAMENGGFEQFSGDRFAGFTVQDKPGVMTFADTQVAHSGKASLRIEGFGGGAGGVARVVQDIRVTPNRQYRVSCWVKTQEARPAALFSIRAQAPDGRNLSPFEPPLATTGEWRRLAIGFNSWYAERVALGIGVYEGQAGTVWVDDCALEEVGLLNVVRRDGTPLRVREEASGVYWVEGRDFAPIADPLLNFKWDHDGPAIQLTPGTRIREGARLRVDYYHGTTIYNDQVSACPSEPRVYEIWRQQFPLIEKYLAPRRYFLNLDEIRVAGHCETCKRRNMTMAQVLGDMARRLYEMIREVNPKAEVWLWSDMFDPNHNARAKYYLVDGDYTGSWEYLPKDLRIACWYYERRRASLDFFSGRGFATLAAAYYDADDLKNPQGWLEALDATRGARGIMYTTWENKYGLLGAFGDLVSKPR